MRHALIGCLLITAVSASGAENRWMVSGHFDNYVAKVAVDPSNPAIVLLSLLPDGAAGSPVWRSDDGGVTWRDIPMPEEISPLQAVEISASFPSEIHVLEGQTFFKLHRSVDRGAHWTTNDISGLLGDPDDLNIDPSNDQILYLALHRSCVFSCNANTGGVARSTDGGKNWRRIGLDAFDVQKVLIDPADGGRIYAIAAPRIYTTTNTGSTWTDITPSSAGSGLDLTIDPVVPSILYVSSDSGIFKTTDRGNSWRLLQPFKVYTVAIAPRASMNLLASGVKVLRSSDGGETFSALNDGLKFDYPIRGLAIAADNTTFYAFGRDGFFRYGSIPPRKRTVIH